MTASLKEANKEAWKRQHAPSLKGWCAITVLGTSRTAVEIKGRIPRSYPLRRAGEGREP